MDEYLIHLLHLLLPTIWTFKNVLSAAVFVLGVCEISVSHTQLCRQIKYLFLFLHLLSYKSNTSVTD